MASQGIIQRSFASGELAPALHARADLTQYLTGARTVKNFFVRKEGGVSNRAGFRYVDTLKDVGGSDLGEAILLRYVSETIGQSILIECGDGYLRFYLNGAAIELTGVDAWSLSDNYVVGDIVAVSGVNYYAVADSVGEDPTGTSGDDVWYEMPSSVLEIPHGFGQHQPNWHQSGRTITLTHGEAYPQELIYLSATHWVIRDIVTEPWAPPPTSTGGTAGTGGALAYSYVVTAAKEETYEETEASAAVVINCDTPTPAAPNQVTFTPVTGAAEHNVYLDPYENGVHGFINRVAGGFSVFVDPGFVPDFNQTPPIARDLFPSSAEYPHVSGSFEQRRVFAQTPNTPDQVDLSRVGFPSNFGISSPLQDDDALRFRIAGASNHAVRWLLDLTDLIVGTAGGVWVVKGSNYGPLVPGGIDAKQHVYAGAHDKRPAVIGNSAIYLQARGKVIRDVYFEAGQETRIGGRDLTVFASHLFESDTFARIDYAETPHSILWAVRNDGVLLGLTYLPDEQLQGWHRHETQNGLFEDVCVVPEAEGDVVYVIVKRTIDDEEVRYIERLESRVIDPDNFDEECFFVDCGLSYSGAPADTFTGLEHLEGQVVAVVADGAVLFDGDPDATNAADFTIDGGSLALADSYENVHIGLPIRFADLETLDLDVAGSAVRDSKKGVHSVTVLIDRSSRGFQIGPDADNLKTATAPTYEGTADEWTGQLEVTIAAGFNAYGRVLIRQTQPLPLTILGIIPNVELGG